MESSRTFLAGVGTTNMPQKLGGRSLRTSRSAHFLLFLRHTHAPRFLSADFSSGWVGANNENHWGTERESRYRTGAIWAVLVAAWAILNGTWAMMVGLNKAYGIKEERSWWRISIIAFGLTISLAT